MSKTVTSTRRYNFRIIGENVRKDPNLSTPVNQSYSEASSRSVTYGDNLSNWRYLIANGLNATTSLAGSEGMVFNKTPGYVSTVWTPKGFVPNGGETIRQWRKGDLFTGYDYPTDPSSVSVSTADNKAKIRFIQRVKSTYRSFQGGVALGELRETLGLIRNPAKALRGSVDTWTSAARRNVRTVAPGRGRRQRQNRVLQDSWLEYSFGWKPLLSDIDSAMRSMEVVAKQSNPFIYVTADADHEVVTSGYTVNLSHATWLTAPCTVTYRDYAKIIYRGTTSTDPKRTHPFSPSLYGFSVEEFVPTVWELIPYSFLVDYFTNIGDVLEGFSFRKSHCRWIARTAVQERKVVMDSCKHIPIAETSLWSARTTFLPPTLSVSNRKVSRSTYLGDLVPRFDFEIPGMGSKWLNLGALARARRV